ncbi:Abi family protein [Enterovibrio norvegicus]|uniref:Abi family protein n=1 Tax=Enterovibrio norvegicus TaxID=188144 RepID=UPI00352D3F79
MAESQEQFFYTDDGNSIKLNLSEKRFEPYLKRSGYKYEYAFNLYLFNARLSKAFLFPLHILEVSLRNRINTIFIDAYGDDWPFQEDFRKHLSEEAVKSLDTGIRRAKTEHTDDIVATMSFDFWSNLFRSLYDRPFWQTHMNDLVPNQQVSRKDFQKKIREINKFRNRIAHHEPIHHLRLIELHKAILVTLEWLCADTKSWVHHYSSLNNTIKNPPTASGESKPHFGERCDSSYSVVDLESPIVNFPNSKFIICLNNSAIAFVMEKSHLANYLLSTIDKEDCILADLNDHTYADISKNQNIQNNFVNVSSSESFSKTSKLFTERGIGYILVNDSTGIIGIIAKSHRRY